MQGLQYANIASELRASFPTLMNAPKLNFISDDEPDNYLVFLISYVRENWDSLIVQERLADLMEKMFKTEDPSVEIAFSDFALGFYLHFKEHNVDINPFMDNLSMETRNSIQSCVDYWLNSH